MTCFLFLIFSALFVRLLLAHPLRSDEGIPDQSRIRRVLSPEFDILLEGNKQFRTNIETSDPYLLKNLAENGQAPPFMFVGCSDSRVSEGTVFNAKPGTFFTERNIANQYHSTDLNALTVLSYAVSELHVKHIVVMGHYGCGGVAAAIASPSPASPNTTDSAVHTWVKPIREIYLTSTRLEIVKLREKNQVLSVAEKPKLHEPGFRALVEENVKANVRRIASDRIIVDHYAHLAGGAKHPEEDKPFGDIFIHGWVYNIENGRVIDLGISVGPPGKEIPASPFA